MSMKFRYTNKHFLDKEDILQIKALARTCQQFEPITLKLELEYKFADALAKKYQDDSERNNEFFCYQGDQLIGYLGVCQFGSSPVEINGMVHPDFRRQGIFMELYQRIELEMKRHKQAFLLMLCDPKSVAGIEFLNHRKALLCHTEYEMIYHIEEHHIIPNKQSNLILEKATNNDIEEIHQQNRIAEHNTIQYEESEDIDVDKLIPEEEEKRGVQIYLIKKDDRSIGKIHITTINKAAWIYGFVIKPEFRGFGYGKCGLLKAISLCKNDRLEDIFLQVDSMNNIAFQLYKSVGFEVTSAMEYYKKEL